MTNFAGRTLSHYRLEARIGVGGMGEVYRGVDTRLSRPVAVKILPPDLLQDDERRRRFTQEAKAASALNHPNIVTIYDVGSEAGIDLIVMEHVEGKTLEEIIGRRPMAIGPLLRYAAQIADALTAAHAVGIVHRDLKPTNIMVTAQGLVKVLDFGLAKLTEVSAPDAEAHTRTVAQGGSPTERGMIVGTASYMSPEQAEGGVVDARSDIFSFGSVLYEMATGRRAFEGSTTMSTIAAVLRDEPPRVSTITAPLPHDLEVLITRCLKKDPNRRVQHVADLKVALQELKEDSDSGRLMTSVGPAPADGTRRRVWPVAFAGIGVLTAIAAAAGWYWFGRPSAAPKPPALTRLTFDTGMTRDPAISRDGKLVVYASDRASKSPNLWVQQIESGQAVQLTHYEEGAGLPSFSPDGTRIAYQAQGKDEGIYVVATIGGEPRKIASTGFFPRFSPDGTQIAYHVTEEAKGRLMLVAANGGQPTKVSDLDGAAPLWSSDGSHLLAVGRQDPNAPPSEAFDWFVISIKDGTAVRTHAMAALRAQKVLTESVFVIPANDWLGDAVLFSLRNPDGAEVWRLPLDPATFQPAGPAEQVTFGTAEESSPTMSMDGKLAFAAVDTIADYWMLPLNANTATVTGPRTKVMGNSASERHALSVDGTTLFFCGHRGGQSEIRSRDLRTGKETPFISAPTEHHINEATADGSSFLYLVPGATPARFLGSTTGAPPRKVCENCGHAAMSRDGTKVLYMVEPDHHTYRLLDVASGVSTEFISSATLDLDRAAFSPDGQWAAVNTLGGRHLFLVPVRNARVEEQEWIVFDQLKSRGGYQWPAFSPDGNTLYYVSSEDGHFCVYARRLSPSRRPSGAAVVVQHLHESNAYGHPHGMAVGADKIVLLMNQGTSNIWLMSPRR